MLRILLAASLFLASAGAYAQFNRCGPGFCPQGVLVPGIAASGGGIVIVCVPGNATGVMDFSVCSNTAITSVVF